MDEEEVETCVCVHGCLRVKGEMDDDDEEEEEVETVCVCGRAVRKRWGDRGDRGDGVCVSWHMQAVSRYHT